MATSISLPAVTADDFLQRVKTLLETREGQTRDKSARYITMADLEALGITQATIDNSSLVVDIIAGDTMPPGAPTNLEITNSYINHILTWTNPTDEDLSHIEVWRSMDTQNRTQAELVGIVTKPTTTVSLGGVSPRHNYYYWIRAVDEAGNYSAWCPSDQMGGEIVAGEFAASINDLMEKLTDDSRYKQIYTIIADSFRIVEPSVGLTEGRKVFTTGNINGQPTVGISGDLIVDGTVLGRMLAADCVDAGKINTNDIYAMNIQSGNYIPNSQGFKIDASNGTAEFNAMKFKFQSGASLPTEITTAIDSAKTAAITSATTAAKTDAEALAGTALSNAKTYADSLASTTQDAAVKAAIADTMRFLSDTPTLNNWGSTEINGGVIKTGTITSNVIGSALLIANSANISSGVINNAHISDLSANKLTAGTLRADIGIYAALKASIANVDEAFIKSANITELSAAKISAGTLGANVIYSGSVAASQITAGTLGANVIYGGSITANQITAGTLGANVLYGGKIYTSMINDQAVTIPQFATGGYSYGNGSETSIVSLTHTNGAASARLVIIFSARVGYSSGNKDVSFTLTKNGSQIYSNGGTTNMNDNVCFVYSVVAYANESASYAVKFRGADSTVFVMSSNLYVMGAMK